ncbi:MAG: valine--tRNA ligase [Patescibacteria group bacterium]|jgi:valyl-tRNA synthetase
MNKELSTTYNPLENEDQIYQKWDESGYFNPDNLGLPASAPSYTIVLPPPNITDKLHIGHASTIAIEDFLIRYHRLKGYRALWLPGTDHAAIATQNVVEKKLLKETGQTRHNLGREKFLAEVEKFVSVTQATILHQTKKMGASLDWSRLAFTLDAKRQLAVRTMFKDMYDEGIIYRGERIVNWCPRCHSTLADDEVEYKEQTAKLYTFKYDTDFPIAISTTRPETKLGDTAVAVNPKDKRYQKFIGQEFSVDFCGQALKIKVIADRGVESDFGTGALGVTPAHSMVDWQMAQANQLPLIKVINEDGMINDGFGVYAGLTAIEAREKLVTELNRRGLMEKEEDINNNISVCYRCHTSIEPLPSEQWFISVDKKLERLGGKSLKDKALTAARSGEIKFIPERFNKRYCDWMENLHDWCISRQIWFGHQIPVWYKGEETYVGLQAPADTGWQQDPDTLDTWFSSGMWTFSTLGWPTNLVNGKKTDDLVKFHPTQVLETGYEILTLWVSRMIMMSFFALDEVPFQHVYLHGMILDGQGKKMSKSKGNGVDPLDMIAKYGADATRLSLLMGATPGNDSRFNEEKIESKRNFINKLWNISRFILSTTDEQFFAVPMDSAPAGKTAADKWILQAMSELISQTGARLDSFDFSLAAEDLYEFTRDKLADWYLEIAKIEKDKEEILVYLLKNLLILWHPFIPFVTETIWTSFNPSLLMVAPWPKDTKMKESAISEIPLIQEIVIAIRNARSEKKIEPARKLQAVIYGHRSTKSLQAGAELIKSLRTGLSDLTIQESGDRIPDAVMIVCGEIEIYLSGLTDPGQERERLMKETVNLTKLISLQEQKLAKTDFIERAPEKIIKAEQDKLAGYRLELEKITKIIKSL